MKNKELFMSLIHSNKKFNRLRAIEAFSPDSTQTILKVLASKRQKHHNKKFVVFLLKM